LPKPNFSSNQEPFGSFIEFVIGLSIHAGRDFMKDQLLSIDEIKMEVINTLENALSEKELTPSEI
jgi:hypothetical protein